VQVQPGSPAQKAGLREGDLILALNGKPVTGAAQMRNRIGLMPVGTRVHLELLRQGRLRQVEVTIASPLAGFILGEQLHPYLAGAMVADAPSRSGAGGAGVLVGHVDYASNAWTLGLRKGDVIVAVNRQPVDGVAALAALLRQADAGLLLRVRRGRHVVELLAR
jgi:S1-C subfamily serine protease